MKLITRVRERTLMRRKGEPAYQPWTLWELCEGTDDLSLRDCRDCVRLWHDGDDVEWDSDRLSCRVETPYSREEYRIVPDDFNVEGLNNA